MALPPGLLDLTIIGAGIYGVCTANIYLSLHPEATILVLDADEHPGGVWSKTRLYPKFYSQTGSRLCGFPDVPFKLPEGADTFHDLFEAKHLSRYFDEYLDRQVYDGRSLRERFVFGFWVGDVRKDGDGVWIVTGKGKEGERMFRAKKMIVATGSFTQPFVPDLPGRERFKGRILHQKDFGRSRVLTAEEKDIERHTNVTVLGGAKSAADIVFAAATDPNHPRTVTWIIRTSGVGPLLMTHPKGFGKYRSLPEVASTRIVAAMSSADPFAAETWWDWFTHRTSVGEWLINKVWTQDGPASAKLAGFDSREGRLEGFEGLRSTTQTRWRSGHAGIIQREDWWDVIARKVRVVRGEIERLEEDRIVLQDGTKVESDLVLAATGWVHGHTCFSAAEKARLGLPLDLQQDADFVEDEKQHWQNLDEQAERKVHKRWPYLASAPKFEQRPETSTPYRLYKLCVPITDQSIAFLGIPLLPNSYHTAVATTLWAIATLDGAHALPSPAAMEADVAFMSRWCANRYPVAGGLGNLIEFEMVSYTDSLLRELGLSSHRKEGWWADLTDPVLASDYAGVVDEFRRMRDGKGGDGVAA